MKPTGIGRNDPCPCGSGKKFKHCCLGSKESSTSSSLGAASISETLRKALEGQQFNTLEEAQAFVNQFAQQQNRRPLDEFHGLSPEQMHRILDFPFTSPGLVRFPEVLDAIPAAPILTLFELLANAIGEQEKWTPIIGQRDKCILGSSRQPGSGFVVNAVRRPPVK